MENLIELTPNQAPETLVTVKFAGSNRQPEAVAIRPGNTARDVLRYLGLDNNFAISDHNNDVLTPDQPLFGRVPDGSLLHVTSVVDAGCGTARFWEQTQ